MRHMITENWTEEMQWANQRYLPKYSLMEKKCAKVCQNLWLLILWFKWDKYFPYKLYNCLNCLHFRSLRVEPLKQLFWQKSNCHFVNQQRCGIVGFLSSGFLKTRERYKYLVCLSLYIFWGKCVFTFQFLNDESAKWNFFDIIVNFNFQKLKNKHTSLKKYTNWDRLSIFFSRID